MWNEWHWSCSILGNRACGTVFVAHTDKQKFLGVCSKNYSHPCINVIWMLMTSFVPAPINNNSTCWGILVSNVVFYCVFTFFSTSRKLALQSLNSPVQCQVISQDVQMSEWTKMVYQGTSTAPLSEHLHIQWLLPGPTLLQCYMNNGIYLLVLSFHMYAFLVTSNIWCIWQSKQNKDLFCSFHQRISLDDHR